ncbi:patatin-like phospholipase family protein [Geomonas sp. Red69]|uniref:patatin-like phospholipase family protein n=1 Tax=Geomonas diazotrophica TaxID=2843197 RepID=UPI001C1130B5|nr:patatin-like phospholipase family protein [Geomonas diazotrophica]MBU5638902.1 patatin-like phospholipase family protein [Geomonas diazotrophica]
MFMRTLPLKLFLFAALCCAGCAHYHDNPPASSSQPGYRYDTVRLPPSKEKPFVVLAFSGGGTRAAAFSFGLMEELQRVTYTAPDASKRSLLQDVEIVSSVSGGSFTSAYYALFPDTFFTDFPKEVLTRNIQGALVWRMLNPYNWWRLASPDFSRIDMAEEYYDHAIFKGMSFGALLQRPKGSSPFLVLNATDIGITHRFEFTQDQFDLLCSDLSGVSVSRGVAASSNFPVAFAPLTLNIYKDGCVPLPLWVEEALKPGNRDKRRIADATAAHSYREPDRRYAHLLDGGLSDNLGLRGPFTAVTTLDSAWSLVKQINRERIGRIIFISANAKTTKKRSWDAKSSPPGVGAVLDVVMNGPMDDVSFDSLESTDGHFNQMKQLGRTIDSCNARLKQAFRPADEQGGTARGPEPEPIPNPLTTDYGFVELTFDDIPDPHLRRCLQELPTNFSLPEPTTRLLRVSAQYLLMNSERFQEVMKRIDAKWQPDQVTIDQALINEVCGKY